MGSFRVFRVFRGGNATVVGSVSLAILVGPEEPMGAAGYVVGAVRERLKQS